MHKCFAFCLLWFLTNQIPKFLASIGTTRTRDEILKVCQHRFRWYSESTWVWCIAKIMGHEFRGGGNGPVAHAFILHVICDHIDILEVLLFSTRSKYLASARSAKHIVTPQRLLVKSWWFLSPRARETLRIFHPCTLYRNRLCILIKDSY